MPEQNTLMEAESSVRSMAAYVYIQQAVTEPYSAGHDAAFVISHEVLFLFSTRDAENLDFLCKPINFIC